MTVEDIQAIVKVVGGEEVDTYPLFKGCIVAPGLAVTASEKGRLPAADVVVWTGFFGESQAIYEAVKGAKAPSRNPSWIDVSHGVKRVNVPVTECSGTTDVRFMHGDPFFWLNPENGAVIARNLAEGLARVRPERARAFHQRATAFSAELRGRILQWKADMARLKGLKVFGTQCGWLNLMAALPGPAFGSCKSTPGQLPSTGLLVQHVRDLKVEAVLVDPNTPPAYEAALRDASVAKVLMVPSSIEHLKEKTYFALFENVVRELKALRNQ